jgi:hypothetical protein
MPGQRVVRRRRQQNERRGGKSDLERNPGKERRQRNLHPESLRISRGMTRSRWGRRRIAATSAQHCPSTSATGSAARLPHVDSVESKSRRVQRKTRTQLFAGRANVGALVLISQETRTARARSSQGRALTSQDASLKHPGETLHQRDVHAEGDGRCEATRMSPAQQLMFRGYSFLRRSR